MNWRPPWGWLALAAFALAACGPDGSGTTGGATDPTDGGDDANQVFVALQQDFDGFSSWPSYDLGVGTGDGLSNDDDRIAFINTRPPHGSSAFPIGTIIVKTDGSGADAGPTFAMVKRGGGFNAKGADGWELFELTPNANGGATIVWRGTAPPLGDNYAGMSGNSCNQCHAGASNNDFVPSPQLSLGSF